MSLIEPGHQYSYSQLSSFDECKYGFYLLRIERIKDQASNAFAQRGSLVHELLDMWAKGILSKADMLTEYENKYSEYVQDQFPRMMKGYTTKAYEQGIEFLKNFDEFKGYEVLLAEEKYTSEIPLKDGTTRPFVGVVDLVLRDLSNGDLIVCDHKSKSERSFQKDADKMYMQQYMYSQFVKDKYGEYPKRLMFHLFNADGIKPERPFDLDTYNKTMEWAADTIEKIEACSILDWFVCKEVDEEKNDFFCTQLCSARNVCPNGQIKPPKKRQENDFYYEGQQ